MKIHEIEEWFERVNALLQQCRLLDAMEKIEMMVQARSFEAFEQELDELRFTYSNMLKYSIMGVNDPSRDSIYDGLILKLYDLADLIKLELLSHAGLKMSALKFEMERQMRLNQEDLTENLLGLSFDFELEEMLRSTSLYDDESESESAIRHRKAIERAFHFLWLTNRFSENDAVVVGRIFDSESFPWQEKALLISALTLGLVRTFDKHRLLLLVKLYNHSNPQLSMRALTGILLILSRHHQRIVLQPKLREAFTQMAGDTSFEEDTLAVIMQLFRARNTEQIARKFRDEIVPDIMKLNQDLSERLNLEKLLSDDSGADRNPDWESYLDNQPDLVRRLEDLTNMQMEGNDVFISTFAMLKNFPFFNSIHHWFMPFYTGNFTVVNALDNEKDPVRDVVLQGVNNSPFLCNSDKYSFVLNLRFMPEAQKEMIAQMLAAENEQLHELLAEELADPMLVKKRIIIQYVQDLYRFFTLNAIHAETGNVFSGPLDTYRLSLFETMIPGMQFYHQLATFCFDAQLYPQAAELFEMLLKNGESSAGLYERNGYCLQQMADYTGALEMYQKADLFDTNRKWLLQKMAQCYLKLQQPREALKVYSELSALYPDDMRIQAAMATCYLNTGNVRQALEHFYRLDLNESSNPDTMRPLAWCLFLLNRCDEASAVYTQLLQREPNAYDFMNAAHVEFCLGHKSQAATLYQSSIEKRGGDVKSFLKAFASDKEYLIQNGVAVAEIPLLVDFVRSSLQG